MGSCVVAFCFFRRRSQTLTRSGDTPHFLFFLYLEWIIPCCSAPCELWPFILYPEYSSSRMRTCSGAFLFPITGWRPWRRSLTAADITWKQSWAGPEMIWTRWGTSSAGEELWCYLLTSKHEVLTPVVTHPVLVSETSRNKVTWCNSMKNLRIDWKTDDDSTVPAVKSEGFYFSL